MNAADRELAGRARVLALCTPEQIDELLADVEDEQERRRRDARRMWTAMMLARDIDTCQALLRGEHVPKHHLDPKWLHLLERWPEEAA